ncbi:uncharacterized protein BDR25DRAFT_346578 [Lindgomyces ingoldianus]|uniref:Uncharacterized protein n=1 Tax=Lindgomyces ingoldianus TaxID=673940 RepID=A0ACB6QD07_9PLEO|nr:uncharacterized protein BDR25DRAFT_346578 [Lindgomyces ingoldianus]KAF2464806.1 hypothetical protein BDR25DRAFT_346578 [Lindgomyces ingoldianus]
MSTVSNAVIDDTKDYLARLRTQTGKPLRDAILEEYKDRRQENHKSTEFLKNLKCFLPIETMDNGWHVYHYNEQTRPIVKLYESGPPAEGYVAVSWPWKPAKGENDSKGAYRLQETNALVEVRNIVLDRIIQFIRYKRRRRDMIPFWIDKLSITQEEPSRQEGMQSMDLVYKQCKFAVGHLWVEIETQVEMNHLANLLSGQLVNSKCDEPFLQKEINDQTADEVLDLLVRITDDQWWNRAWIYQEDYLAGEKMWLLIRHARGLDKSCAREVLGDLSGEVAIKSTIFKHCATLFCLALPQTDQNRSRKCEKVISKAGKYNILCKYRGRRSNISKAMTLDIFRDLDKREIKVRSDLLAIAANVCGYSTRIPTIKGKTFNSSLSLSLLTLYIANGEILKNNCKEATPFENVFKFLETHAIDINAPLRDGVPTFTKHCRLSVSSLSEAGIHTKGILWKLSDLIRPGRLQNRCSSEDSKGKIVRQRDVFQGRLNDYQRGRLFDLVTVLKQRKNRRYKRLRDDLIFYLKHHNPSTSRDDWPSTFVMDIMATSIVDAMDDGKYLQLARPVGGFPTTGRGIPYGAMFARDRSELQCPGPTYIFTSWARTKKQSEDTMQCKTLAKYVSVEVGVDVCDKLVSLRTKKWINGLCLFRGQKKYPFIFPWPESLSL